MGWREVARAGIRCGDFLVRLGNENVPISEIESIDREKCSGDAIEFRVTSEPSILLPIVYLECSNGSRDIRILGEVNGPQALRRLEHGLRMAVSEHPGLVHKDWVQLSQARIKTEKANLWSNLFKATKKQLELGAGFDVLTYLREKGAISIEKKYEMLGLTRRSSYLCMTFEAENKLLPVLAYVSTRVLPLYHKYENGQMRLM